MTTIGYIRKVFQMTVISIVLVALTTLIVIFAIWTSAAEIGECNTPELTYQITVDSISLSWTTSSCAVVYNVTHYYNGNAMTRMIPDPINTVDLTLHPCSKNIVTVVGYRPPDLITEPGSIDFVIGIIGDSEVQNLAFNGENNRFEWKPPENSEQCNLEYEIHFTNEITNTVAVTSDLFYEIVTYPCSTNNIMVTTLIGIDDNSPAGSTTASYIGPATRTPPDHIRTNPQMDRAYVAWLVEPEINNFCDIQSLRFEIIILDTDEGKLLDNDFIDYGETEYTLQPLVADTFYQYRVCYVFAESVISGCSSSITFLTKPLTASSLELETITDQQGFTISWTETYNSDFITGHTLHIEEISPNHFIPEYCYDTNVFERKFDYGENSYFFEYTQPSFRYGVILITHFSVLGMDIESEEQVIDTDEDTPGSLTIKAWYNYEPATSYNVTLEAMWGIPCNVNGNVRSFTFALIGKLSSEAVVLCKDVEIGTGVIPVTENLETHTTSISGILPFFEYSLLITTNLDEHASTTEIDLGEAPAAYTRLNEH